jgi:hypothetical protein
MTDRIFVIRTDTIASNLWAVLKQWREALAAGTPLQVTVGPHKPTRTIEQNAKCHAMLHEIGESLGWKWHGISIDMEDLKSIMVAAFRKARGGHVRMVPGVDGEPVLLNWRTRDFKVAEMAEFIEMLECWQAEHEVPA